MGERPSPRDGPRRQPQYGFESIYGQRADPRRGGWKGPSQPPNQRSQRPPQTLPPIDAPPPVPPKDVLQEDEFPDPIAPNGNSSHRGMRRPVPARVLHASNGAGWGAPKHAHLAPLPNQPVAPPVNVVAPPEPRGLQGRRPQPKGIRNVLGSPGSSLESRALAPEDVLDEDMLDEILEVTPEKSLASTEASALEDTAPRAEALNFNFQKTGAPSNLDASKDAADQESDKLRASPKAVSVAALQKLFFEELANGNDANGAAAKALLRLTERTATSVPKAQGSESHEVSQGEGDFLVTDEDGFTPRQPTPLVGGNRSQAIRVSNCL